MHSDAWDLRCLQASSGVLAGESVNLQLPTIQLLFESYRNVTTSHCGTAPDSAVVFGIAASMAGDGRFKGLPWRDGITVFDSHQELLSFVPPVELITLVADRRCSTNMRTSPSGGPDAFAGPRADHDP